MEKLRAFFEAMTFWNWIALVAFIFFPFSALNAFFSLKSRFRDWRGMKSKRKFDKRLAQLKRELNQIEIYNNNLPGFFLYVLSKAMLPIGMLFASVLLFMGAFAISRLPFSSFRIFEFLYLGLGIVSMMFALDRWKKLTRLVRIVNNSKSFGLELLDFIYAGRRKGFIVGEEDFILSLMKNKIFTNDERVQLFSRSFDLDRSSINEHGTKPVHRDNGA